MDRSEVAPLLAWVAFLVAAVLIVWIAASASQCPKDGSRVTQTTNPALCAKGLATYCNHP